MFPPSAKVRDEVLANFARSVDSRVRVEALPRTDFFKRYDADRKQHSNSFGLLAPAGGGDFGLNPITRHAVRGQDEDHFVVSSNGLINLFMDFLPMLHVVGCKRAADSVALQIRIQPIDELLILRRITDET